MHSNANLMGESKNESKEAPQNLPDHSNIQNDSNLLAGLTLLNQATLLKPEYQEFLTQHPQHAVPLATLFIHLNKNNLLPPVYQAFLFRYPQHTIKLAERLPELIDIKFPLTRELLTLRQDKYGFDVFSVLSIVIKDNIRLSQESLRLLIKHKKYSPQTLEALQAVRPITQDFMDLTIRNLRTRFLQDQKVAFLMGSNTRLNAGSSTVHFFQSEILDVNLAEIIFDFMSPTSEAGSTPKPPKS